MRLRSVKAFFALAALLLLAGTAYADSPGNRATGPEALNADQALWIDVRTAEEYGDWHVPGASNIPYEEIAERIGEVTSDKDASILLYCRSGRRSGIALKALHEAGFKNAVNVGGLDDARREIESSASR